METCTISGTIVGLDGEPVIGAEVVASVIASDDLGGQVLSDTLVTSDDIMVVTDEDGEFEIDLLQGATVLFCIAAVRLRKRLIVPCEPQTTLAELI